MPCGSFFAGATAGLQGCSEGCSRHCGRVKQPCQLSSPPNCDFHRRSRWLAPAAGATEEDDVAAAADSCCSCCIRQAGPAHRPASTAGSNRHQGGFSQGSSKLGSVFAATTCCPPSARPWDHAGQPRLRQLLAVQLASHRVEAARAPAAAALRGAADTALLLVLAVASSAGVCECSLDTCRGHTGGARPGCASGGHSWHAAAAGSKGKR
jgi:hypothetical protein